VASAVGLGVCVSGLGKDAQEIPLASFSNESILCDKVLLDNAANSEDDHGLTADTGMA
jgi:hypothetical protein